MKGGAFIYGSKRILVIDDDVQICQLLEDTLEDNGYTVFVAHDGKSGLKDVEDKGPDLILLDVTMPGMNGFDVLKRLKKSNRTNRIPVIMLTGKTDHEDIEKAIHSYADKYITKPFHLDELLSEIKKTCAAQGGG